MDMDKKAALAKIVTALDEALFELIFRWRVAFTMTFRTNRLIHYLRYQRSKFRDKI